MAVKFHSGTKHGKETFLPSISLAFDDPLAENYFIGAGLAEATTEPPVHTYPEGTVVVDPMTRVAATGEFALPEQAQALQDEHGDELPPAPHEAQTGPALVYENAGAFAPQPEQEA